MSYDIAIGDYDFNYTYNMGPLFHDHIDGGLQTLSGLTGQQAALVIGAAFDKLNDTRRMGDSAFCAKYDSPNGWGSTVGAILLLGNIMNACIRHPRAIVQVW